MSKRNKKVFVLEELNEEPIKLFWKTQDIIAPWIQTLSSALGLPRNKIENKLIKEIKESIGVDGIEYIPLETIMRIVPKKYKFHILERSKLMSVGTLANQNPNSKILVLTRNRKNNAWLTLIEDGQIIDVMDSSRLFVSHYWIIKTKKVRK